MIPIKSPAQIAVMAEGGRLVARLLRELGSMLRPGLTTAQIAEHAGRLAGKMGVEPAFLGYHGYPSPICVSVNEEVVHGIPSPDRTLREGDIVGLDFGALHKGFFSDSAVTFPVGKPGGEAARLLRVTREALFKGIEASVAGNRVGDISQAVQRHVEENGYSVVKTFVGHGIGRRLHEDPQVPNFGESAWGATLKPGMTLAIEPMVNAGSDEVRILEDGWTAVTMDGSLSAHFEHTIAVTAEGPVVLTEETAWEPRIEG